MTQPAYKAPVWPMLAILAIALGLRLRAPAPVSEVEITPKPVAAIPSIPKPAAATAVMEDRDTFVEEMKAEYGDNFGQDRPAKEPPGEQWFSLSYPADKPIGAVLKRHGWQLELETECYVKAGKSGGHLRVLPACLLTEVKGKAFLYAMLIRDRDPNRHPELEYLSRPEAQTPRPAR